MPHVATTSRGERPLHERQTHVRPERPHHQRRPPRGHPRRHPSSLQADGGDCELVDFDSDGVVSLRLTGACQGCPLSSITLSAGIERILREHVPGVERVQAVM